MFEFQLFPILASFWLYKFLVIAYFSGTLHDGNRHTLTALECMIKQQDIFVQSFGMFIRQITYSICFSCMKKKTTSSYFTYGTKYAQFLNYFICT